MEQEDNKYQNYKQKREQLVKETKDPLFNHLQFSQDEETAFPIWEKMIQAHRHNKKHSYYHTYTLRHRNEYENSDVFKVLSKMPKGSTLHIHLDCCLDQEWFIREYAFNGHIYINEQTGFFDIFKDDEQATEGFVNLLTLANQKGREVVEQDLRKRLPVTQQEAENFDIDIWSIFEQKIIQIGNVVHNSNFWGVYLRKVFQQFIDEGIMRVEARAFVGWLLDDDKKSVSLEDEFKIYEDAIKDTQAKYPDFSFGMTIQGLKVWDLTETMTYYKQAFKLRKQYPHIVTSFDMVQEEDAFKDVLTLAEVLVQKEQLEKEYGIDFPFCLHGGESQDTQLNTNLYDMLLLKTKRIGHGINLAQHSHLIEKVKQQDMCLELCVLSNQVLRYYNDIRVHPLKSLLNSGVKCCLAPDDPGIFGLNAVNHDFYAATIGSRLSLKELKVLVHNSVFYSLFSQQEKEKLWAHVNAEWNKFISWFLSQYKNENHVKSLDEVISGKPYKQFL